MALLTMNEKRTLKKNSEKNAKKGKDGLVGFTEYLLHRVA